MSNAYTVSGNIHEYSAGFQEERDGGYSVWVPDLPGCASQGETPEEAMANIKEAAELYLEESDQAQFSEADTDYTKQFVVPIKIAHA